MRQDHRWYLEAVLIGLGFGVVIIVSSIVCYRVFG
jgi:hypothetical protein